MAKFDIPIEAKRPLYAGVGVTDLAVEAVRELRHGRAEDARGRAEVRQPSSTSSRRRSASRP